MQADQAYADALPAAGPLAPAYQTLVEPFDLVMPSGNRVYGLVRRPDPTVYPNMRFAAVVKVPGGINAGRTEMLKDEAKLTAGAGMVVVGFNAEGRIDPFAGNNDIQSEGEEDYNGFRNQDGLRAIIQWTMALPYVIPGSVGL